MRKRQRFVLLAVLAALLASAGWWQFGRRDVPAGQRPLSTLDASGLAAFRDGFNASSDGARHRPALADVSDVSAGASAVQSLLDSKPDPRMRVFVVWLPILPTDFTPPNTSAMGRLTDPRVQQFWDPEHLVAKEIAAAARPPQPEPECCEQEGILWDLAAVYPKGARWDERLPAATFLNGPVVHVKDGIDAALRQPTQS